MKWYALLLLLPVSAIAQVNPAWIVKDNLFFSRLENSGSGMFGFEKAGKYGYIDKSGKEVIAPTLEFDASSSYKTIPSFYNGYAVFKKDKKTGMIDKTGKEVIPAEYYGITYNPSSATFTASRFENSLFTYGLLSTQNKVIIPFIYDYLYADSVLVTVKKEGKFGLLDMSGKTILPMEYATLSSTVKEKMILAFKNGTHTVTDLKGNTLFEKPSSVYTLYLPVNGLIRCSVSNKYGFLDAKGNEVITTKYDYATDFQTAGLAQVGKRNNTSSYSSSYLYGYIDKKGVEVIPVKYETLGYFQQGLLLVKDPETNRYGFFDKTGKWAIPAGFIDATPFNNDGISQVKMTDGKYHIINTAGKDLGILNEKATSAVTFTEGFAVQQITDQPYNLIDKSGKVLKALTDCAAVYNFSEGIAGIRSAANSLYGFVDLQGNTIIQPAYTGFSGFAEGINRVSKTIDNKTKYGYINTKGEIILPVEYEDLSIFRNGWGIVKKDGGYFFVDKKGQLKETPRKYDVLQEFRSDMALGKVNGVSGGPNTYYYINTSLKEEFSLQAKEAYGFWDDVAVIRRDKDLELMDKKGNAYKALTEVEQIRFATEGSMCAKQKGKWGFIDLKGEQLIPAIYDSCDSYKAGYARVKSGTKWGIIDKAGKEIVAPKYENIIIGGNGTFIFLDTYWGIMDKTGKVLVPPAYFSMTTVENDKALAKSAPQYVIMRSPRGL